MEQRKRQKKDELEEERERLTKMKISTSPYVRIRERQGFTSIQDDNLIVNNVESVNEKTPFSWSPHLCAILQGSRDLNSPLFLLNGNESTIIRHIYGYVIDLWNTYAIKRTTPAFMIGKFRALEGHGRDTERVFRAGRAIPMQHMLIPGVGRPTSLGGSKKNRPLAAFSKCNLLDFPEPEIESIDNVPKFRELNITMMPFIVGDKNSLPKQIHRYYESVIQKCPVSSVEVGRVGYLTIREGLVYKDQNEYPKNLHIESPSLRRINRRKTGKRHVQSSSSSTSKTAPQGSSQGEIRKPLKSASQGLSPSPTTSDSDSSEPESGCFKAAWEHSWGRGQFYTPDEYEGGLYMASNMDGRFQVWDALIVPNEGLADELNGKIEYVRPFLGKSTLMKKNELVWLSDRTPHEAMPIKEDGFRQFFQLVTSKVTLWYEDHYTPNPLCPLPDHVEAIKGRKLSASL